MGELTQEKLNTEMQSMGVGRYRGKVESARKRDAEIETNYGQRLMRAVLPDFTKGIEDWQQKVAFYDRKARYQIDTQDLDAKVIGYISIKAILDSITKNRPLAQVGIYLGAQVENELRCRFLLDTNEEKGKGILLGAKRRKGQKQKIRHVRGSMAHETKKGLMPEWVKWSIRDKLNMGVNMVEILRSTTGIIEYIYILKTRGKKPVRFVSATPELIKWIEDYNEDRELLEPFWLPTVELPLPWQNNVFEGGYDTEGYHLPKLPFIKTTDMQFLRSIQGEIKEPMEAVNLIQQTPWKVNKKVYEAMKWAWDNNLSIGELPNRKDESFPPIPLDFKTNPIANRDWRREAAKIYELNLSTRSRRMLVAKTLFLAEKFKDERFFMPHQCDFRGRVYSIPSFLNVQSADYARGLLHFSRSEKIKNEEDARWLAIHGANTWGNDKVSLDDRETWAYDFESTALKIADNPTQCREYEHADKPWQFLAWCFEWAEYCRNGKLNTFLPVSMDATNNGLQILSLLMRDSHGAKSTNVLPTEIPEDIYRDIAEKVKEYLQEDNTEMSRKWLDFGIDRSTLKRSVMVMPYGGTFYSCRAYIDEWYQDKMRKKKLNNPFSENDRYKCTGYLAQLSWRAIHEVLKKPTECMNWLKECAAAVAREGKAVEWVTPSGFPVKQSYFGFSNQEVKTNISGKATYVSFRKENDKISVKKNKQGISPNFVHSTDATLLTKAVIAANSQADIWDFSMIHDSFGTHSPKCDAFNKIIRKECSSLFSVDLLQDFAHQLKQQHPNIKLPHLPLYGELDPKVVEESTYFFS